MSVIPVVLATLVSTQVVGGSAPLRDNLVLSLSTERTAYYRGERVRLHASIRNVGQQPVTAGLQLNPALGQTTLSYRTPTAPFAKLSCFVRSRGFAYVAPRTTAPGEAHGEDVDVAVTSLEPARGGFILDQTGGYEFKLECHDIPGDADSYLESDIVTVQVTTAPNGEQAAQASYTPDLAYLAQIGHSAEG
jgi:hypothetical protein